MIPTNSKGSGVHSSLSALVDSLEAGLSGLPTEPTLEDFVTLEEGRRDAAAQLAELDPSTLNATEKRALAARLRKVLERDQGLILALFARRDDVAAELQRVAHARRVAAATRVSARPVRRVA